MLISKLRLKNFRNYAEEEFEYSSGVNIISGGNAQGKTNSVEAIFLLCTGYSPKARRDKQLIRTGETSAKIEADAVSAYGKVNVSMDFYSDRNKEAKVNGIPVAKIGELLGNINSVLFTPSELKLVQDAPEDRRRFLDISLSQISRGYFYALQKYKKILSQRNNLLKSEDRDMILDTLPVWDVSLAAAGAKIVYLRNDFIKTLSPLATESHAAISDGEEELSVECDYKYEGGEEDICEQLKNALKERMEKDIELGYTTVGPHRDDLKIKVNGTDVRVFGSQGQQRTAALSLKIAETEIFRQKFGEYPVLILDDALSELQRSRREKLLSVAEKMQTIITCTEPEMIENHGKYNNIRIKNGEIIR